MGYEKRHMHILFLVRVELHGPLIPAMVSVHFDLHPYARFEACERSSSFHESAGPDELGGILDGVGSAMGWGTAFRERSGIGYIRSMLPACGNKSTISTSNIFTTRSCFGFCFVHL